MPTPTTRPRTRRSPAGGDASIADLDRLVGQLITENTRLKRELARLETNGSGATANLAALSRRVAAELGKSTGAPARRPRAKVTDPAILQKRRESLQKAREARAAKRAAAQA